MLQIVNRYVWWILILIILIVGLVGYYWFINAQIGAVVSAANDNLPQKQDALNKLQATKEDLDQTIQDFDRIKQAKADVIQQLQDLLPEREAYGDLFSIVDQITEASGMQLNSISIALSDAIQVDQPVRTLTPELTETAEAATPPAGINSMTISLSVTGPSYEAFKNYLEVLERSIRLFDVKSLSFDGGSFAEGSGSQVSTPPQGTAPFPGAAPADDEEDSTSFSFELVTYYK